ncbi:MAG: LamG-like jellyroll fold domain-containing protein [bacterium]
MYLSKNKKRTPIKGFTLIELMVVISIIGFLSSIVLASLNVAREKARIISGVQFNASLIHRYAQVAYYNFNDSTPNDQAGKNNGVITGPVSFSSDTFSGLGKSASFNGGEITIPDNPGLDFSTNQSFALSAWIKTTDRNHIRVISKGHWGFSPGYVLQIHCCDSNGNEQLVAGINHAYFYTSNNKDLADNRWHHIAAVFDRENKKITAYIDGNVAPPFNNSGYCGTIQNGYLDISNCGTDVVSATTDPLCIGAGDSSCAEEFFYGLIDEAMVLTDTTSSSFLEKDIKNIYKNELAYHLNP